MAKARKQSGQLRIIAGVHRGRKLPVLDVQGLRPTTDRQKETLFNWLMMDVQQAHCLDMFAGAGSLGIEALSRGATKCVFIEKNTAAAQNIQNNLGTLHYTNDQATVIKGDALCSLAKMKFALEDEKFDLVFIDPPFKHQLVQPSIDVIEQNHVLKKGAKIYIECEPNASALKTPQHWRLIKQGGSQQTHSYLYQAD